MSWKILSMERKVRIPVDRSQDADKTELYNNSGSFLKRENWRRSIVRSLLSVAVEARAMATQRESEWRKRKQARGRADAYLPAVIPHSYTQTRMS
jgi:hypothetical protein